MKIPRLALLCFAIGSGAFIGCGGTGSPTVNGTGGNSGSGAAADQPAATCDGGPDCEADHDGDHGDMGDEAGDEHRKDGGAHKADGGDDGDGDNG